MNLLYNELSIGRAGVSLKTVATIPLKPDAENLNNYKLIRLVGWGLVLKIRNLSTIYTCTNTDTIMN